MRLEVGIEKVVLHGAIGGLLGGAVMGATSMMAFPLLHAGGFWAPLELIAGAVHAPWATVSGFAIVPVMVGMMVHMMTSVMLGVGLALAARTTGRGWLLWTVGGAMAAWAGARLVALPLVDPALVASFPAGLFAMAHAMYGLALGGWLWRALGDRQAIGAVHSAS